MPASQAGTMNSFVTHASVRLKGTEHLYEPVFCCDSQCAKRYVSHMHCPFCVRTESFTDAVILKAHYRVKHVDKGIEFGGLKIVRCCDHCDIVGSIKGSKEIKGAHWHCYRCRNGFNRRDEALKHYRTHFRTPETTFQIHIPQDVNQAFVTVTPSGDLGPPSGHETLSSSVNVDRDRRNFVQVDGIIVTNDDRCLQVSVAANETVDTTSTVDLPTVVVLPPTSAVTSVVTVDGGQEISADIFTLKNEIGGSSLSEVWSSPEMDPRESLPIEVDGKQQPLQDESSDSKILIRHLQLKIQNQAAEIETLKKREAELMSQLEVDLDDRLAELLERMKTEHETLLRQQLLNLRTEYLRHLAPSPSSTPSHSQMIGQPMFILHGSTGQPFQIIQTGQLHSSSVACGFTTFPSGSELLSGVLQNHNGEIAGDNEDGPKVEQPLEGHEQDEMASEVVQNFIVAADDISEYVNTRNDEGDNPDIQEDVICSLETDGAISVSRKRLTDHPASGILLKRERV